MRPPSPRPRLLAALLTATLAAACSDVGAINLKLAPGFTPSRAPISVLGVFKDGRMSTEAWISMGPPISSALGLVGDVCEAAFAERLQQEKPDLFAFVEEDTRNNGITEEMLGKLAPQADGDLILAISVHGRIVQAAPEREDMPPPSAGAMRPGAAGQGLRPGRAGHRGGPGRSTAPSGLELTASLYSIKAKKSVARMSMGYTGTSVEDAFRRFAAEIAGVVPGSTCRGWHWKDPSQVPGAGLP
jgi:hypothetical protein